MADRTVIGEASDASMKKASVLEAIQDALDHAPPPTAGNDVQVFTLAKVEVQFGGFVPSSKTRVTLIVRDGPLPPR